MNKKYSNVDVVSYQTLNDYSNELKATDHIDLNLTGYVSDGGREVFLNPFVFNDYSSNPLKSESRKFPVDFGESHKLKKIVSIEIPEGWSVKFVPESVSVTLPDESATYNYSTMTSGDKIQIYVTLAIDKPIYMAEEYVALRQLFSTAVAKMNEFIVMVKN